MLVMLLMPPALFPGWDGKARVIGPLTMLIGGPVVAAIHGVVYASSLLRARRRSAQMH